MINHLCSALILISLFPAWSRAQAVTQESTNRETTSKQRTPDKAKEEQRRLFAISLITSLADEARSYRDGDVRTSIIARAAAALWDTDKDTARGLFRRAWESAEIAYAEVLAAKTEKRRLEQGVSLLRNADGDLRPEVLRLAARHDSKLGEEFIRKFQETIKGEIKDEENGSINSSDSWSGRKTAKVRYSVAQKLLEDGEIDRAIELVAPVLDQVNSNAISFITRLRVTRASTADHWFSVMLTRVENDPSADANTVSLLSSYVFTPNLYITFSADGGVSSSQLASESPTPPTLSSSLSDTFYRTSANVLLRPLLPPDQDKTSAGRIGRYIVIRRMLPYFSLHARDFVPQLQAQATALETDLPNGIKQDGGPFLKLEKHGTPSTETPANILQKLQEQLDRAKSSFERDSALEEASFALVELPDVRARAIADKIENTERRAEIRRYVDLVFLKQAIERKDVAETIKISRTGELPRLARVLGLTRAAQMLVKERKSEAMELGEEAAIEAKRIEAGESDRARSLILVANFFTTTDTVRAWEISNEAFKAINTAEKFTGEDKLLLVKLISNVGFKVVITTADDLRLVGLLKTLTNDDLYRAVELAKTLQNPSPRAVALLSIADSVLGMVKQ